MGTALHYTLPSLLPYRLTGRKTPTYLLTTGVPGKGGGGGGGGGGARGHGVWGKGRRGQHYTSFSLPCYKYHLPRGPWPKPGVGRGEGGGVKGQR